MDTVRKAMRFPQYVPTNKMENNQKKLIMVRPLMELGRLSPPAKGRIICTL